MCLPGLSSIICFMMSIAFRIDLTMEIMRLLGAEGAMDCANVEENADKEKEEKKDDAEARNNTAKA